MHSAGKKRWKEKKIGIHPATQQHGTSWYTEDPGSQTFSFLLLSVCLHYFPTCHLLLKYLTNSLTQFSLQKRFLKHLFESTSHNSISSHVSKHYSCTYPIFFLVLQGNTQSWVQFRSCSCQDQLLLSKLVNLQQVHFTVRMCRRHPDYKSDGLFYRISLEKCHKQLCNQCL